MKRLKKLNNNTKIELINYVDSDNNKLLKQFEVNSFGLNDEQVEINREKFGGKELKPARFNVFLVFAKSFFSPFNIILMAIDAFNFYEYVTDPNTFSLVAAIIVLIMILASGTMAFIQEIRSHLVIKRMITENKKTSKVIRNISYNYKSVDNANSIRMIKEAEVIENDELVPGDFIYLVNGDIIPADVRIIWSNNLYVNQSSLTGESFPVQKKDSHDKEFESHLSYENIGYMGTEVMSGSGLAIVVATGQKTYFSLIDNKVKEKRKSSSFEKGIKRITLYLIAFMIAVIPAVLLISGLQQGDWVKGAMFTIAIAVGITPEMLPIIVTSNLTRGYKQIEKNGEMIVKNLNSVQNIGAIDILCTDKTGTITSGEISLDKVAGVNGEKSEFLENVLYLNSYFQSGFQNPIDSAVLSSKIKKPDVDDYTKEWEIPFDFERKILSVILTSKKDKEIFTKGAVEEVLKVCNRISINGKIEKLDAKLKKMILKKTHELNIEGYRVIGIAHNVLHDEDVEEELIFYGFGTFFDKPKKTSKKLIKNLASKGISTKVLTGDNEIITRAICKNVDFEITKLFSGAEIEAMDDRQLHKAVVEANVFVKLSPIHKSTIIAALQAQGHVVGFMGDGINDAPVLRESDVAISFSEASNIAQDAADMILTSESLMAIENAVIEGRKSLANMLKYIKVTVASNFGNVISVIVALFLTKEEPMLALHLLLQNLLYDFVMFALVFDNVDEEFLQKPRPFTTKNIIWFAVINGPISSIFDISTFLVLIFGYKLVPFQGSVPEGSTNAMQFHASWFVVGLMTQTAVMQVYRTEKTPFIQSKCSMSMLIATIVICLAAILIPFTPINQLVQMSTPHWSFIFVALGFVGTYILLAQLVKKLYIKKFKEWL
ncbi:Mg(2+) transport ATPase, P-type [Mesoplasma entomophilum]|uniref:Magnesium-transporting ATPase, P-type 1 n=1 Tax=Mesoplasma entomophilum TaxID=2149 RepID=A0A3S5XZK8_9MOLU|nr:magnesium-translocating P-type ATPase [Mesoplasma entomophilum]ATQ35673.1 magnesium-translocating P-type ATPase [Mesoplasma entomophilum]ATZ19642.1 Mg(2+) transport ATPase, P-type [Mesoplasma entomophilum]